MVVIIALNGARWRSRSVAANLAQFQQSANGMNGVSAALTALLELTTTSSGGGSGSRSHLPRMVVRSARILLQPMNLMRSLATKSVAQFLALASGALLLIALQGNPFQEDSIAVEAPKHGFTASHR
jgi:hypothetical protein